LGNGSLLIHAIHISDFSQKVTQHYRGTNYISKEYKARGNLVYKISLPGQHLNCYVRQIMKNHAWNHTDLPNMDRMLAWTLKENTKKIQYC